MTPARKQHATPEQLEERTLPTNLEAERSVLGAIILHNDAYEKIAKNLDSADFFRVGHRLVFDAIERLLAHPDGAVDLVTLKEDLTKHGELDECGGPAYISALIDGVPRSSNIEHYAGVVREKATLRRLIKAANRIASSAYEAAEPASVIVTAADRMIIELQKDALGGRMRTLAKSNFEYMELIDYRIQHKGELTGVTTGFVELDQCTMGWQPSDHIVIAARPSIGKTAFVLNTATAIAESTRKDGSPRQVAFFSMEMRRQQLEDRLVSSLSGLPTTHLRGGYVFGDLEMSRLTTALQRMAALGIHIDDTAARTVWQIRAECRRIRSEVGLDAVIIDYVQLMAGSLERRGSTRNEELTDISRNLKVMADELGVPVLILSQLKRGNADRPDPAPRLDDLRDSGALEQDADLVVFLHRRNHKEGGVTKLIVDKARNGPTGTFLLTLDRDITRFETFTGELPPEPEKTEEEKRAVQLSMIKRATRRKAHSS